MRNDWDQLYRVQDWVLDQLRRTNHSFYLTGGTALSRGYYEHRYSEDLDFFVNDAPDFEISRDRCLYALQEATAARGWKLEIVLREERFGRAFVHGDIPLKLEFINDIPFRVGQPIQHPALGLLDTKENILANRSFITSSALRAHPAERQPSLGTGGHPLPKAPGNGT